jgi:hypothetical protein
VAPAGGPEGIDSELGAGGWGLGLPVICGLAAGIELAPLA